MLRELIDQKSCRDGKVFTISQLAKAINMPHSILVKLIHPDPAKRVNNPRVDTLAKIIEYFKEDGFKIKIDDFLFNNKEVDIFSQSLEINHSEKIIQTFSLNDLSKKIGTINIKLPNFYDNLVAYVAEEEIKPFFKAGSIFIVDIKSRPENDNLVAVKMKDHNTIKIKKILINNNKLFLLKHVLCCLQSRIANYLSDTL